MTATTTKLAAGVAGGYLLGRVKKLRMAITLAGLLAGKKMAADPKALAGQLQDNPQLQQLREQLTGGLASAAKELAMATATSRLESMTQALQEGGQGSDPEDDEDEYDEDQEDDPVDEEDYDDEEDAEDDAEDDEPVDEDEDDEPVDEEEDDEPVDEDEDDEPVDEEEDDEPVDEEEDEEPVDEEEDEEEPPRKA
ncbi:MAG TPA: hypothetical protein VD859_11480, partial [Nocardioides sp.]|nr:hypothetical protein [Nocardioides sp.]